MTLGTLGRLWAAVRIVGRVRRQQLEQLAGVRIRIAWRPDAGDVQRGATPRHRGYFWGVAPEPARGAELPDPTAARGELVVFLGHPAHASELELERTFEHELGHVLGRSEDELGAMGLEA